MLSLFKKPPCGRAAIALPFFIRAWGLHLMNESKNIQPTALYTWLDFHLKHIIMGLTMKFQYVLKTQPKLDN